MMLAVSVKCWGVEVETDLFGLYRFLGSRAVSDLKRNRLGKSVPLSATRSIIERQRQ
jgi:hypothetical protein